MKTFADSLDMWHGFENCDYSTKSVIKGVKARLMALDASTWKTELFNDRNNPNGNKLRTYRLYKNELKSEPYVSVSMQRSHRSILAKFRSGSLPLFVETGRYNGVPLTDRICKLCQSRQIEDERHFLLTCDFYNDLRRTLYLKAQSCNTDFYRLCEKEKLIFLMNNVNLTYTLATILSQMFCRRKQFLPTF